MMRKSAEDRMAFRKIRRLRSSEVLSDFTAEESHKMELEKFKWELWGPPPSFPPDFHGLAPEETPNKAFNSDDVFKDTVKDWVSSQPQEFWNQGILRLVHQWDHCAQAYDVYFE
ncbi:hypothetical protein TNIN_53491 [Trichonephila inaurata madagascariensis]|uniref:Uncharacterized protein n=1 Tax=Trichonephila inaurata madagascariensis TaxID=2747483 RepID=A0A8X6YF30_9ARAC|nr:hypothetical protein TNIN_53491 [Trichonephila inaurata madagascariensis]